MKELTRFGHPPTQEAADPRRGEQLAPVTLATGSSHEAPATAPEQFQEKRKPVFWSELRKERVRAGLRFHEELTGSRNKETEANLR